MFAPCLGVIAQVFHLILTIGPEESTIIPFYKQRNWDSGGLMLHNLPKITPLCARMQVYLLQVLCSISSVEMQVGLS